MSIFGQIIGQQLAVAEFTHAASDAIRVVNGERGDAMTHAWLITGPPGSGRSTIAMSFAASLVCSAGGCGTCIDCRNVAAGNHPDVEHIIPEGVIYSVVDTRALIERAALRPVRSPWHIIIIEDVDRFRTEAASTLLKSLEEPPPQTVWLLCAPTVDDVFPTIRSRCRHVLLNTPELSAIAQELTSRYGIDPAMAAFASRVAQGHIGRARAIATDADVRNRRKEILDIPLQLRTVSNCFELASKIVTTATADAEAISAPMDTEDESDIRMAYGEGSEGKGLKSVDRQIKSAIKDLERRSKSRSRRVLADQYNRVLLDFTALYRDVLIVQSGSDLQLINEDMRPTVEQLAAIDGTTQTLMRIDAINEARDQLFANVTPANVFESLLVTLREPYLATIVS